MELIELWNADRKMAYGLFREFPENDNGFENIAYGMDDEAFDRLVERKRLNSEGKDLPEGFVPDTVFILVSDSGEYVGIFNFRHELNSFLASGPGHIGYGISPRYRGMGYATAGLSLLVSRISPLIREDEIYLSAGRNNPASLRVQMKCGGRVVGENEQYFCVRIPKR